MNKQYDTQNTTTTQIFRITRVDSTESQLPCQEDELISTEEQLMAMTPKEQYSSFQTQAYEIKQLRRKLRKLSQKGGHELEASIQQAKEVLNEYDFEFEDQKDILDNLMKALKTGVLVPNTMKFDRLCTIVRNCMNLNPKSKTDKSVYVEGREVKISKRESDQYLQCPNDDSIVKALLGETTDTELDEKKQLNNYLVIQAELLKNMNFEDFLKGLKPINAMTDN